MPKPCLVRAARLVPLQTTFLTDVLPRVEQHGRVYFRHVKCPDRKEELLAEMGGLAWKWFVGLVQKDKNVLDFVSALANYAARAVNSGRRVCGHERKRDVLSPVAQRLHNFAIEALPQATSTSHECLYASPHGQERLDAFEERLRDNTLTPVPDQVVFRIDFPLWRCTRTERDRRVIDALMAGWRTKDVSQKFGLSPGRVSQLRRDFLEDWRRYCGEPGEVGP
jgi:hypothetical protein